MVTGRWVAPAGVAFNAGLNNACPKGRMYMRSNVTISLDMLTLYLTLGNEKRTLHRGFYYDILCRTATTVFILYHTVLVWFPSLSRDLSEG